MGRRIGGGFEHGLAPNWTVGFEYDHLFFQPSTEKFSGNIGGADRIRKDVDLITVRLNYKFGGRFSSNIDPQLGRWPRLGRGHLKESMARSEAGHSGNSNVMFKRRQRDPGPSPFAGLRAVLLRTGCSAALGLGDRIIAAGSALSTIDTESQPKSWTGSSQWRRA